MDKEQRADSGVSHCGHQRHQGWSGSPILGSWQIRQVSDDRLMWAHATPVLDIHLNGVHVTLSHTFSCFHVSVKFLAWAWFPDVILRYPWTPIWNHPHTLMSGSLSVPGNKLFTSVLQGSVRQIVCGFRIHQAVSFLLHKIEPKAAWKMESLGL